MTLMRLIAIKYLNRLAALVLMYLHWNVCVFQARSVLQVQVY